MVVMYFKVCYLYVTPFIKHDLSSVDLCIVPAAVVLVVEHHVQILRRHVININRAQSHVYIYIIL